MKTCYIKKQELYGVRRSYRELEDVTHVTMEQELEEVRRSYRELEDITYVNAHANYPAKHLSSNSS